MHKLLLPIVLLIQCILLNAQTDVSRLRYQVYFFLLEDCKITQAYTDKMRVLYSTFVQDSIQFTGYFPNPISTDSTVQAFAEKHRLPFNCTRRDAYAQAKRFGVSITPEVVVYNIHRDSVYYQGRIDNLFERLGQRRQVVSSHELEAALYCIQNNKMILIPRTKAVGCFLP
jgi:hypothetical protein